ncbi:MAG: S-adenosylmethionine decarboxylase [Nitrospirota bacterium]
MACDVFSCGDEDETDRAVTHIKERLCHEKIKLKRIKRGFRVSTKTV